MTVAVTGVYDKVDAETFRFLHEASRMGPLTVCLWSDDLVKSLTGNAPKCSLPERQYVMDALRYVDAVDVVDALDSTENIPPSLSASSAFAVREGDASEGKRKSCVAADIEYRIIPDSQLAGFPAMPDAPTKPGKKNIIVTGCYDWFHSGHIRFFEEVSQHGNLHVVVGHDANVEMLKGEGHPMFKEDLRRYMVQSIRFVTQAYVSTGHGWMDAEPEVERLKPDVYAVNEDGDRPEKREFCREHDLEYLVLKRDPKPGLPRRTSTDLRGF